MNSESRANPNSVGVEDGARLIGVARSAMYDYIGRGEIPTFKLGRRRLILFKSLEAFVSRQAQENSR
ncbi:DNA-binding protein [Pseudomonas simiae]|nr:DNA-binding protein [Pseudomonas simiae]